MFSNGFEIVNHETGQVVDYAACITSAQRRVDALVKEHKVCFTYRPVKVMENA